MVNNMALSQEVRGLIENYIDIMIRDHVPLMVSRFRQKKVKDMLQYENEEDFIYSISFSENITLTIIEYFSSQSTQIPGTATFLKM
jgi:hypothetical protein